MELPLRRLQRRGTRPRPVCWQLFSNDGSVRIYGKRLCRVFMSTTWKCFSEQMVFEAGIAVYQTWEPHAGPRGRYQD